MTDFSNNIKTDFNSYNQEASNAELLSLLRKEVQNLFSSQENNYIEAIESFIFNIEDIFIENYRSDLIKEFGVQEIGAKEDRHTYTASGYVSLVMIMKK
jgi:hypothetical protein